MVTHTTCSVSKILLHIVSETEIIVWDTDIIFLGS